MTWSLALDTPGEICREVLKHKDEVEGLVVFAFTNGGLTWGATGKLSSRGLMIALQILHAECTKFDALMTMEVEGNG